MRFWTASLLVIIALVALSCTTANKTMELKDAQPIKVSLVLDWFPWSNHSGLFIAQNKGYFREAGLEVEIRIPSDPSTVNQTVASGRDDFGLNYQIEVLLAREQDVPVKSIMALVQHPLNSIMTLQEGGAKRPRELKGRKIGYPGIAYNEPMIDTMLKSDGVSLADVTMVNVGFDLVPALISKKVDAIVGAYWVHESISAKILGFPVNVMRMEEYNVPDFYEIVLVTSESMISNRPDVVKAFVGAVIKGYRDAIQDPQGAIDILAKMKPEINQDIERPGVDLLAPLWAEGVPTFGWQEERRWLEFGRWMQDNGLLSGSQDDDLKQAFTNRFVQEATHP